MGQTVAQPWEENDGLRKYQTFFNYILAKVNEQTITIQRVFMFVSQTFQSFANILHSGFVFSTFGHLALMENASNGARSTNRSYIRTSRSTWGRRWLWIMTQVKNDITKRVMFRLLREAIKVKTENKLLIIFFSTLMTSIREKWGTFVSPGTLAGLKMVRKLRRPPCNDLLFKVTIGN